MDMIRGTSGKAGFRLRKERNKSNTDEKNNPTTETSESASTNVSSNQDNLPQSSSSNAQ